MKTKIFTLLFALIVSNSIMFGARQIDGIWYSLDVASYTARVTYISSTKYEGNVIIPASVEYETNTYTVTCIGPNAFKDCTGLTSVTIPNSVTEIRSDAFNGCSSLTSVTIPNSVTKIGGLAFADCSGLISVSIGSGVSSISSSAFNPCTSLSTVMLNSDTIVGADYNLLISTTIQNIFGSQVTEYIIGDSVTSIGMMAFYGCNGLSSVIIGNRVASIGYSAFADCTSLTSVTISSSVKSIKQRAFHNCTSLNSIICEAVTPPYLEWDSKYNIGVFTGVDKSIPLYVPAESIYLYKAADQWKDFTNILPIGTVIDTYRVEFRDIDNTILKVDSVDYGKAAVAPADPYRQGYTFVGWDKEFSNITSDLVVTAKYELGEKADFTISFDNKEGDHILSNNVVLKVPAAPEIEGFTFKGWRPVAELIKYNYIHIEAVYEADEPASAPAVYTNPANSAQKLIRNGNVYILTEDKTYTITGLQVK